MCAQEVRCVVSGGLWAEHMGRTQKRGKTPTISRVLKIIPAMWEGVCGCGCLWVWEGVWVCGGGRRIREN